MKVDRRRIVEIALDLLNEKGVDGLTTRLIATRLGVQQPALYWHFKNKRALLDAMNVEILARGHTHRTPLAGEDWRTFLRENARSFRRALLAYRDGARVHAGTEADPQDLDQVETQLAFIVAAGLAPVQAMELLIAISHYTVGCVLEEQAEAPEGPGRGAMLDEAAKAHPLLSKALAHYRDSGQEQLFEAGLELLIGGAAAQLRA
jgi:TetR/AcrR family tetracycline transcriptional repressor